mmetsp:Transcript_32052/g.94323  ORF Transcript_32052/g.94323 Transcript_32052/m.94323 type:complete len:290 (+) Transcript_32052:424-1293(+)
MAVVVVVGRRGGGAAGEEAVERPLDAVEGAGGDRLPAEGAGRRGGALEYQILLGGGDGRHRTAAGDKSMGGGGGGGPSGAGSSSRRLVLGGGTAHGTSTDRRPGRRVRRRTGVLGDAGTAPAEVAQDSHHILPSLPHGAIPARRTALGAHLGQIPSTPRMPIAPMPDALLLLGLEDAPQMIVLQRAQRVVEALGRELLQTADGDGRSEGPNVRVAGLDRRREGRDGLEGLEVGLALELDGLAFVGGEPAGVVFGGSFVSNGPDGNVEAEGDELGRRGGGGRRRGGRSRR